MAKPFARRGGAPDVALLAILVALWVLLWGDLSVANVLSGLVVAVLVVRVFPMPRLAGGARLHPIGLVRFLWRFLTDLVSSTVDVAWQVLRIGPQPRNAVIAVTLRSQSDLVLSLTGVALTLLPGSLIVEVRRSDNTLFVHVFNAPDTAAVERARRGVLALEARLIHAIGSKDDLARLHQATGGSKTSGKATS